MIDLVNNLGYSYVIGYSFPDDSFLWYTPMESRQAQFLGLDIVGIR